MLKIFKYWMKRYFSNYEATVLLVWILLIFFILALGGRILAPVLVALILAYLMQGIVNFLMVKGIRHKISVYIIFSCFITILSTAVLFIVPIIGKQLGNLINSLPRMLSAANEVIAKIPNKYPFLSDSHVSTILQIISNELADFGQTYIASSYTKILELFHILIYCILVPFLIFFFLKDKDLLLSWVKSALPKNNRLITQVVSEMNDQIANYIRGKGIEILVVGLVSYVVLMFFKLNYAELIAIVTGLSVIVPYVGAALSFVPVIVVAIFQWGLSEHSISLIVAFTIIHILDGNVLAPILFSDAVGLHPVVILIAVLVFGGIWGFWGIFFAIPLATLLKAIISAWPIDEEVT